MEYETIAVLRDRHPAWRLLRAVNAALLLSFLPRFFVEANRGATSGSVLGSALDAARTLPPGTRWSCSPGSACSC